MTRSAHPLRPFLERQGVVVLDGGLATTLEAHGHVLDDPLWSARLLLESPEAIAAVHDAFLQAGADCLTTASYQASVPGFMRRGVSPAAAEDLLRLSVQLGLDARQRFLGTPAAAGRLRPLVAASIGPWAAFRADASEYSPHHDVDRGTLRAFHSARWHLLAAAGADLLACETIPARQELEILLELLRATPDVWAWCSVTCRDGGHLRDGTPLAEAFAGCDDIDNLVAVGINCTAPDAILPGIRQIRRVTRKPVLVYANSGEVWDGRQRAWGGKAVSSWGDLAVSWRAAGAQGIGGCCRVGPAEIGVMRQRLVAPAS